MMNVSNLGSRLFPGSRLARMAMGLILVVAVLLCGCGQRTLPTAQTYTVTGHVLVNGKPAAYVIVHFEPVEGGSGVECVGQTDGKGNFGLRTFSNEGEDGAVPGEYQVTILPFDPVSTKAPPKGAKPTVLPKGVEGKKKTIEVKAEDNDITLKFP
jgi:hypothetical protein